MARLSKQKGVELMRFERGNKRLVYFSGGWVLSNTKGPAGKWGGWKRETRWMIGTLVKEAEVLKAEGWVKTLEMGKTPTRKLEVGDAVTKDRQYQCG
jgi:hypothetical protein